MKILRIYNRVTKEVMMPPRAVIESYGNSEFFILEVGDHVLYICATAVTEQRRSCHERLYQENRQKQVSVGI